MLPGGNLTGFNALNSELGSKQLALFHELVPNISTIGFLENPGNPIDELMTIAVQEAAAGIGLRIQDRPPAQGHPLERRAPCPRADHLWRNAGGAA
jgi:ABC-type uncharacterized transport system substrate-binding protein